MRPAKAIDSYKMKRREAARIHREKMKAANKVFKEARKKAKFMPFAPELSYGVMVGKTVASFRLYKRDFYPKAGETFVANVNRIGLDGVFRCIRVTGSTLREVYEKHWQHIGVPNQAAYLDLMKEILHKETLEMDRKGFLYIFERIA